MTGRVIAVTGTTTFFGEELLAELEADRSVERIIALDTKPPPRLGPKSVWHKLDLIHPRAPEALATELTAHGCDTVVHTAILARPVHRGGWAHELEAIGTRHVLAAAEATSLRKLIIRSTTLCYGALASNPNYLPESAPLEGGSQSAFIADKVEVETQASRFAQKHPDCTVSILRFAPLLGPRCDTLVTLLLRRRFVPMLFGFDPLLQVLHQEDAIAATVAAVRKDVRGAINVAAPGVVALSRAIRLAGGQPVPLPRSVLHRSVEAFWTTRLGDFPPGQIDFLKYPCVGDLRRMREELEFEPRLDATNTIEAFRAVKRLARAA